MFLPTTEINNPSWPVRDVTGNIAICIDPSGPLRFTFRKSKKNYSRCNCEPIYTIYYAEAHRHSLYEPFSLAVNLVRNIKPRRVFANHRNKQPLVTGAWRHGKHRYKIMFSLYDFGARCLKIREACMDFEPYFKVQSLVSVHPKSIILGQPLSTWSFMWWCQFIHWVYSSDQSISSCESSSSHESGLSQVPKFFFCFFFSFLFSITLMNVRAVTRNINFPSWRHFSFSMVSRKLRPRKLRPSDPSIF